MLCIYCIILCTVESVRFDGCYAVLTDELFVEDGQIVYTAAEVTAVAEFAKADFSVLRVNLNCRTLGHIHFLSQFFWNNDSSKLVNVTNYSCCFH